MRKPYFLIAVVLLIALIATPVIANSYYHEVTIELDGEWDLTQKTTTPTATTELLLKGIGKGKIHSIFIEDDPNSMAMWWELF